MLEQMPELQELFEALRKAGMADLAWAVLGGFPIHYRWLAGDWRMAGRGDIAAVAGKYLTGELNTASETLSRAVRNNPALAKEVYSLFKDGRGQVSSGVWWKHNPLRATPDRVLRPFTIPESLERVLVPSTPAMGLALRYSEDGKVPSLDVLREALRRV